MAAIARSVVSNFLISLCVVEFWGDVKSGWLQRLAFSVWGWDSLSVSSWDFLKSSLRESALGGSWLIIRMKLVELLLNLLEFHGEVTEDGSLLNDAVAVVNLVGTRHHILQSCCNNCHVVVGVNPTGNCQTGEAELSATRYLYP